MTHSFLPRGRRRSFFPLMLVGVMVLGILLSSSGVFAAPSNLKVAISDGVNTPVTEVEPGQELIYRVDISNTNPRGGSSLTIDQVVVTLDADIVVDEANGIYIEVSDNGVYNKDTHTVTWDAIFTVEAARTKYRYVSVFVREPLAAGTEITNELSVRAADDLVPATASDTDVVIDVAPVAVNTSRTIDEDTTLNLDLGTLGTDANGGQLIYTITTPPTNGTHTLTGSALVYTPNSGYNGPDSFTYSVSDGTASDTGTVSITVTPVNDPPVAGADSDSTNEDAPLTIASADLLVNDTDSDSPELSITSVGRTSAQGGTVTLDDATGAITYTPALNFYGTDTFTYEVSDGNEVNNTAEGTVTIIVRSVNDAPSFDLAAPTLTLDEDAPAQSVTNWATNISKGAANEASQTLTFVTTNNNNTLFLQQPSIDANGILTFTPAENAYGDAIVTVYLQDDGGTDNGGINRSSEKTFTISISAQQDDPVANDDSVSTPSGVPITIAVLDNDTDADGNTLSVIAVSSPLDDSLTTRGRVAIDAGNTTVTYTPPMDFVGTVAFSYTVSDGQGGTARGTVMVNVFAKPTATDRNYSIEEDKLLNVSATDGLLVGANPNHWPVISKAPTNGSVLGGVYLDGSFKYQPKLNFNGTDTFEFYVTDGTNKSDTKIATITVAPVNDAPTMTIPGMVSVLEDSGPYSAIQASNIKVGPADESAQQLSMSLSNTNPALFSAQPTLAADGTLAFTPVANAFGSATVTVVLSDNGGTANGGQNQKSYDFTITVASVNDAPSFTKGTDVTVTEDSGPFASAWASGMAAGPANESTQTLSFMVTADKPSLFAAQPVVDNNGALTFTPAENAAGSTVVTVVLFDNGTVANGGQNAMTTTFTITITAVNDAPTAGPDTVTTTFGRPVAIATASLLRNDIDPDGDTITLSGVSSSSTAGGTVTLSGTEVIYTPAAGFTGTDTFTYTITDPSGSVATGTVTVMLESMYMTFMPLATMSQGDGSTTPPAPVSEPDLIGSVSLSPAKSSFGSTEPVVATATVTNQGTAPAGPFWVDLYINPLTVPATPNIAWNTVCTQKPCQGIAWYVKDGLAPGQTVTLTSNADSYMSAYTIWSGLLSAGTTDLYLYVDSWNPNIATGGVLESNETNNRAELPGLTVSGTAAQAMEAADASDLPQRPAHPSK